MTKQELEKAIENGESVWIIGEDIEGNKRVGTKKLNNKYDEVLNNKLNGFWRLNKIFKTKAEAEHYLHHANVARVEKLPFLTWEEFDKGNRLIRFIGKNGERCKLEGYQSDDTQGGFIDVVVNGTGSHIDYDYTEANFYKAYDECVRLFKGETK